MKKKIQVVYLLFILLFFAGCSNPFNEPIRKTDKGSLSLTINEEISRVLLPYVSMEPVDYVISGLGPNSSSFTKTTIGSNTIENIVTGLWTITVTARNIDNVAIGEGQNSVIVDHGDENYINITINPFEGAGILDINLEWTSGIIAYPKVEAVVDTNGAQLSIDLNITDNTASITAENIATGYHTLILRIKDGTVIIESAVEIIRIVKAQTTTADYSFDISISEGKVIFNLITDLYPPLDVVIYGGNSSKIITQTQTLKALVNNYNGNIDFKWYVDGISVGTGNSYELGSDYAIGDHRIDVIAFTADRKRAGDASRVISVTIRERSNIYRLNSSEMYLLAPVFLDGIGNKKTTLEEIREFRKQMEYIDTNSRITWGLSNSFVFDEDGREQLEQVIQYVDLYGDELSFAIGFANNNTSLKEFKFFFNEMLYMFRYNVLNELHKDGTMGDLGVFTSIPEKYRPSSVITYSINIEQAKWLETEYGISSYYGNTATQYNVDQLSAEGSPLGAYYAHINNVLVPAQDTSTNSDCVFLNTITVDPVGSTYSTGESRWTLHPADPVNGAISQIHTITEYIENPYRTSNTSNYLSVLIDINWIFRVPEMKNDWLKIIEQLKSSGTKVVGVDEYITAWQVDHIGNNKIEFNIEFKGSGVVASDYTSSDEITYFWSESMTERIILSKLENESNWNIIDFTDYSYKNIPQQPYTTHGAEEDISFITGRNFKITSTAPITESELERVKIHLEQVGFEDDISEFVNY